MSTRVRRSECVNVSSVCSELTAEAATTARVERRRQFDEERERETGTRKRGGRREASLSLSLLTPSVRASRHELLTGRVSGLVSERETREEESLLDGECECV